MIKQTKDIKTKKATKTKYCSWSTGPLPKGCALCVQGKKLVLFITGICAQRCFYCPINEKKFGHDAVYANEWKLKDPDDLKTLLEEAKMTDACGAGITGGDPLAKTERCVSYIKLLKKKFGKRFHVHLYTPLKLVNEEKLSKLHSAGLDEIRFHPDLDDETLWPRLKLARKYKWDVGVEIPVIPGYEIKTKKLIDFLSGKVDFINLNELERSDTQVAHYRLDKMKYEQKDRLSYGIIGSEKLAIKLAEYASSKGLRAHYCTAKLKDSVQMAKRIARRAKHAALPCDRLTPEGLLFRGCVYLKEYAPNIIGYRERIKNADKKEIMKALEELKRKLKAKYKTEFYVDDVKPRLIVSPQLLEKKTKELKKMGLVVALVEEYPTADAIEVEVEIL
jgi:hypothetical protein